MNNAPNSEHHHGLSLSAKLALGGAAIAAGMIVAPYVFPALGITSGLASEEALFMLHNAKVGDGIAGAVGHAISLIPAIGTSLAEGGWFNIGATALTGFGSTLLGNWMSKNHEGKAGFDWGKAVKWGGLATSALISLPSILTGITNGMVFLTSEFLSPETATAVIDHITKTIGYTPYPSMFKAGTAGVAASLPHLLTCGASIAPLLATIGLDVATEKESHYVALDTKGKPLPSNDKNHQINEDERKLVEDYNNASPHQKILLKREILERGYDPDFHKDGTVHLFKHAHTPQSSMAMG